MNESHEPAFAEVGPPADPSPTPEPWPGEDPAHVAARNARLWELRKSHPRQWVVYRDEWDGARLAEPFVVAHSADYGVAHSALAELPPEQRARAAIYFVLPQFWSKPTPIRAVPRANSEENSPE